MSSSSPNEAPVVNPLSCVPLSVNSPATGLDTDVTVGRHELIGDPVGLYSSHLGLPQFCPLESHVMSVVGPTSTCPVGSIKNRTPGLGSVRGGRPNDG